MEKLIKLKSIIDNQIIYGPSEHAMVRIRRLIEEIEEDLVDHVPEEIEKDPDLFDMEKYETSYAEGLQPGTRSFDSYVFQKCKSKAHIKRIASKFGLDEGEVMQAYYRGQDMTKV